eukprot:853092-Rhodomonas_salina.1
MADIACGAPSCPTSRKASRYPPHAYASYAMPDTDIITHGASTGLVALCRSHAVSLGADLTLCHLPTPVLGHVQC